MDTYKEQAMDISRKLAARDIVPYDELTAKLLNVIMLQNFAIIELLENAATKTDTIHSTCND